MNATQLFHVNGSPAGLYYCGTCRLVFKSEQDAEQHCRCTICGEACPRDSPGDYTHMHNACWVERNRQRQAERIEKATEVEVYDGPVYVDGYGPQDGYFEDIGAAEECVWDTHEDGDKLPQWAFCCTVDSPRWPDVSDVIDRLSDELYDGFSDDLNGLDELDAAFAAFREANSGVVAWHVDHSRKIRLVFEEAESRA